MLACPDLGKTGDAARARTESSSRRSDGTKARLDKQWMEGACERVLGEQPVTFRVQVLLGLDRYWVKMIDKMWSSISVRARDEESDAWQQQRQHHALQGRASHLGARRRTVSEQRWEPPSQPPLAAVTAAPRSAPAGGIRQQSAGARGRYPIAPAPTATPRRCPIRPSPAARPLLD